jgi:hypothetical protein
MDITFKFNNETPANDPGFLSGNNPNRFIASRNMAALWTLGSVSRRTALGFPPCRIRGRSNGAEILA